MPKAYNFLNVILSSMSDKIIFALCVMLAKLFLSDWLGLGFEVSFGTLIPLTSEEEFKIERVYSKAPQIRNCFFLLSLKSFLYLWSFLIFRLKVSYAS